MSAAGAAMGWLAFSWLSDRSDREKTERKDKCDAWMPGYAHAQAGTSETQAYVRCVQEFYRPQGDSGMATAFVYSMMLMGLGYFARWCWERANR